MMLKEFFPGDLFPFTLSRSVMDIRIGILTIREKWEHILGKKIGDAPITGLPVAPGVLPGPATDWRSGLDSSSFRQLRYPWQIFQWNGQEIENDFRLLTAGRPGAAISSTNQLIAPENIFLEEGVSMEYACINASEGPVYIGRRATIMEGAFIRGPFALCEGAVVKMGATIYGATTIGPYCVAGGEIKNSVLFGYSNKSHGGYLGDSVIGEWCNLGAGTSNSNVKNNAGTIKIWNEPRQQFADAGNKCGLFMGDYTRAAINTSFNTGTVTGVAANIFGAGLTPKYIPSFSWGFNSASKYRWEKALEDIANWKRLKNSELSDQEIRILKPIFEAS